MSPFITNVQMEHLPPFARLDSHRVLALISFDVGPIQVQDIPLVELNGTRKVLLVFPSAPVEPEPGQPLKLATKFRSDEDARTFTGALVAAYDKACAWRNQ